MLTKKKNKTRGSITPTLACTCRVEGQRYQHIKTIAKKTNREKLQKTNKMDDLKNLTAEKVIPVTPEKQEEEVFGISLIIKIYSSFFG